jgi:signal recognition particle receptor subunit beta
VDYFERRRIPFALGVNCFEGAPIYEIHEVRDALELDHHVPILLCDARERESTKQVLLALLEHLIANMQGTSGIR